MSTINRKEIIATIKDMRDKVSCSKDFVCFESGFERICKARDDGLKDYLICLESDPSQCNFALAFGTAYYCHCPIRVYISKKPKK